MQSIHADGEVFGTPVIPVGADISGRVYEQPVYQLVLPVLVGASEDG